MKGGLTLALLLMLSVATFSNDYSLIYKWEDEFSDVEKKKVKEWIQITYDAVQKRIGDYPFDVHLFIYRKEGKGEPCPWANTWRYPNQQVHFHIDPSYSLQEFLDDWTAPHELSHLAIPYIGEKEPWFSEGFASFMQYQVMEEMGILSPAQCDSAYTDKLRQIASYYSGDEPFAIQAMNNRASSNYKAMYWGGASLFLKWNEQLEKKGKNLCSIFPDYLECCRKKSRGVTGVVEALDEASGYQFGLELLKQYREQAVSLAN